MPPWSRRPRRARRRQIAVRRQPCPRSPSGAWPTSPPARPPLRPEGSATGRGRACGSPASSARRRRHGRVSRARARRSRSAAATSVSTPTRSPARPAPRRASAPRAPARRAGSGAGTRRRARTPARRHAATTASASSGVAASGFSSSTCLPAAARRSTSGRCAAGGVRTIAEVIVRSSMIASRSPVTGKGNCLANASRRIAVGLKAAATSTRCARSTRLLACGATAMPRPMRAMRGRDVMAYPVAKKGTSRNIPQSRPPATPAAAFGPVVGPLDHAGCRD